jgi:hypothetical protein
MTGAAAVTGAALVLVLVQGIQGFASFGHADHIGLLLSFCAAAGAAAAARLWWKGCFESKLFTALLALFALAGLILRATLGWPGDTAAGWTGYGVLVAVLAPTVLALVALTLTRPGRAGTPYSKLNGSSHTGGGGRRRHSPPAPAHPRTRGL